MSNVTTVPSAVARTARTGIQAAPAWAVVEGIDAFFYDLNDRQFGIAVILLTMLFSFIQNTIENGIGKGLFRLPTAETPVLGDRNEVTP